MKSTRLASLPTIKRLPSYLHLVENAQAEGKEYISGTVIAEELELEPIQVRKDLAVTGVVGKPRLGFPVDQLIQAIHTFLHWDRDHNAILVGAGNLGTALLGYREFRRRGMNLVGAFDLDEKKIGKDLNGTPVYPLGRIHDIVKESTVRMAILTVPSSHAQAVADLLVKAGITAIWNFTNVKLKLPPGVVVQKEDLSSGYAVLSVKMRLRGADR